MTFKDWWTDENNPSLPKSEYLYNARHIAVLIIVILSCIVFTLIFRKKSERAKNILFNVFGGIFLFFEILTRIVSLIILDNYTVESVLKIILPMHICSVMVGCLLWQYLARNNFC